MKQDKSQQSHVETLTESNEEQNSIFYYRIKSYVPEHLVEALLKKPEGYIPGPRYLLYTLMSVDISGFTALTEEFSMSKKKDGAEILTGLINQLFTGIIKFIEKYRGSVLKFGGDSLLAMFPVDNSLSNISQQNAVKAGIAVLNFIKKNGKTVVSGKKHFLGVHIGIHHGKIFSTVLGKNCSRREYFLTGKVFNELMIAQGLAHSGDVVLSKSVLTALPTLQTKKMQKNYYLLIDRDARKVGSNKQQKIISKEETAFDEKKIVKIIPFLTSLVPDHLVKKYIISGETEEFLNEHRKVTSMFVNVIGFSDMVSRTALPDLINLNKIVEIYYERMMQIVAKHDGMLGRFDYFSRGDKILIHFGALSHHEDDSDRAVLCALELIGATKEINEEIKKICQFHFKTLCRIHQKIGIEAGSAFCGLVGAAHRKEYTVMGKSVNTAARLMAKAPSGSVYIGNFAKSELRMNYDMKLRYVALKGVSLKFKMYCVRGVKADEEKKSPALNSRQFVGRVKEMTQVNKLFSQAENGTFAAVNIVGEPGIGKSTFVSELLMKAKLKEFTEISVGCSYDSSTIPYYLWSKVLKKVFNFLGRGNLRVGYAEIKKMISNPFLPLAAELIGLVEDDNSAVSGLYGEKRQKELFKLIPEILLSWSKSKKVMLVIEDIHWADDISFKLLVDFVHQKEDSFLFLVTTSRPFQVKENQAQDTQKNRQYTKTAFFRNQIMLRELSQQETKKLIYSFPCGRRLSKKNIEIIFSKTAGNPFFISEILSTLNESEELIVPDKVQSIILSRMDRLSEESRTALKLASVIGQTFRIPLLNAIYPSKKNKKDFIEMMNELKEKKFIFPGLKNNTYFFRHALIRDATYDCLSSASKIKIHGQIANWIEANESGLIKERYEVLANHFSCSNDRQKAIKYLILSGKKVRDSFANQQAVEFFSRALKIFEELYQKKIGNIASEMCDVYMNRGMVYRLMGLYDRAIFDFKKMNLLASKMFDKNRRVLALNYIGSSFRWKGNQKKALVYCSRALKLALSLRNKKLIAVCYNSITVVHWYLGNYRQAIYCGKKSLALRRQSGKLREISRGLFSLGNSYTKICDFNSAKKCFNELMNSSLKSGDKIGTAYAYDGLGYCEFKHGRINQALRYYEKGFTIRMQTGDMRGIVYSYISMGDVKFECGSFKEALEYYRKALEIVGKIEDENLMSDVLRSIGLCAMKFGNYQEAIKKLNESLLIGKKISFSESLIKTYCAFSELMLNMKRFDKAKKYLDLFYRLARKSKMLDFKAKALMLSGLINIRIREKAYALKQIQKAFKNAVLSGDSILQARILTEQRNCFSEFLRKK